MEIVKNWKAKRAGGRITIYGENVAGQPRRVVGVDLIEAGGATVETDSRGERLVPVATDKNGARYALA